MARKSKREKPRPILSGVLLIMLGVACLLWFNGVLLPEDTWPLIIIFVGLAVVARAFRRRSQSHPQTPQEPQTGA
jgi:membrane protein implicated in regulation of membrane protease activity